MGEEKSQIWALENHRTMTAHTNSRERGNGNRRDNKEGKESFLNLR